MMIEKPKVFFIAGTDTGVGKTLVAAALLNAARERGISTVGLKPLAAGGVETLAGLRNEDALLLHQYTSLKIPYELINPVCLRLAAAPHIAAEKEGRRLDISRLEGFCRAAMVMRAGLTLIEGAGGWRVPVNARQNLSDLAKVLNIPVILVVGMRLGCLNHALLSAQAILADGLRLAGWVANQINPDMPFVQENIVALEERLHAPCLARIPYQSGDIDQVIHHMGNLIDMDALLSFR